MQISVYYKDVVSGCTAVSAIDAHFANYRWSLHKGYAWGSIKGEWNSLHRFVLNAKHGESVVHLDGDKLNNTRENLQIKKFVVKDTDHEESSSAKAERLRSPQSNICRRDDETAYLLIQGKQTLVDDDTYLRFEHETLRLNANGYPSTGEGTLLHRIVMNAKPDEVVDHINGDILDARRASLRICSVATNNQNRAKKVNASSPYIGVSAYKSFFECCIKLNKRKVALGTFKSCSVAAWVYDQAARHIHGKHAKLNGVEEPDIILVRKKKSVLRSDWVAIDKQKYMTHESLEQILTKRVPLRPYIGVHFRGGKYRAGIHSNKKNIYIGSYNTAQEAAAAYNEEAKRLHGTKARLNNLCFE